MKRYLIIGLLIIISLFSGWLILHNKPLSPHNVSQNGPDHYMKYFVASTTDENGQIKQIVKADFLQRFPNTKLTQLDNPQFEIYNDKPSPWRIQAKQGIIHSITNEVQLHHDVLISRNENRRSFMLRTESLLLDLDKRIARTDDAVTITQSQPPYSVTAVGMSVDIDKQIMTLENQVSGYYAVNE